jgi:hypothetical protein
MRTIIAIAFCACLLPGLSGCNRSSNVPPTQSQRAPVTYSNVESPQTEGNKLVQSAGGSTVDATSNYDGYESSELPHKAVEPPVDHYFRTGEALLKK